MPAATLKQQQSSMCSLNYRSCSVGELCKFVQSRTTLTARAIRKLNKAKLVSRLTRLDAERTFWRFMDLPPELRLDVYQRLLLIDGQDTGKNHSALLRVSKLIHSESEPVLYSSNSFCVEFDYPVIKFVVSGSWESEWDITQHRIDGPPERTLPPSIKIDMLLGLRQLTLPMSAFANSSALAKKTIECVAVQHSMTHLCLTLSSARNLKALNITDIPQGTSWDSYRPLYSSIALIHQTAKITIEGASLAVHDDLEDLRRSLHSYPGLTLSACGTIIARTIQVLNAVQLDGETTYMVGVVLGRITNKPIYQTKVEDLAADFRELDRRVTCAEAELADI